MRNYLYAGAVAGCFLLLGAAPAQADVLPAPQGAQQDTQQPDGGGLGLLDPANGLNVGQPLGGSPLIDVNPGDNSVLPQDGSVLPARDGAPAARTGFGTPGDHGTTHAQRALPAADVVGQALPGGLPVAGGGLPLSGGGLPTGPLSQLPIGQVLGGRLPLIGGLLPNGQSPFAGMTQSQEAGLLDGGLPLLGGLGGLLPSSNVRSLPALSGLPGGGTAINEQPAQARPARIKPAKSEPTRPRPAVAPATDPATTSDTRLHEEPTDPVGRAGTRTFSTGRPVAGVDPEFH